MSYLKRIFEVMVGLFAIAGMIMAIICMYQKLFGS